MVYMALAALVACAVAVAYGSQGPAVVCSILVYLGALSTIKLSVKCVFVHYDFPFADMLTVAHFTLSALATLSVLLYRACQEGARIPVPNSRECCLLFLPICVALVVSVGTCNLALVESSAAFVEIISSSSCLFTIGFVILLGMPFNPRLILPALLVVSGCIISAAGEVHFSLKGLLLALTANAFRSLKVSLQQMLMVGESRNKFDPCSVLFWMSTPSIFIMFATSLLFEGSGPARHVAALDPWERMGLLGVIFFSSVNATILLLAQLFVTKHLGAVGGQLISQAASVLTVLGSITVLGESVGKSEVFGFAQVLVGVYIYAWMEQSERSAKSRDKPVTTQVSA